MAVVESRFVTQASRDRARHLRRQMQRNYGLGLTNLIHPVTKEFNHEAVIERRGGRHPKELLGNTKDIGLHDALEHAHKLIVGASPQNWAQVSGKNFDTYDVASGFYGFILSLQGSNIGLTQGSNCFFAMFGVVEQLDFMVKEFQIANETLNIFNALIMDPLHAYGNWNAAYE